MNPRSGLDDQMTCMTKSCQTPRTSGVLHKASVPLLSGGFRSSERVWPLTSNSSGGEPQHPLVVPLREDPGPNSAAPARARSWLRVALLGTLGVGGVFALILFAYELALARVPQHRCRARTPRPRADRVGRSLH